MDNWYSRKSRMQLSRMLHRDRASYIPLFGSIPTCPICSEPIIGGGNMYEALITRSSVIKTSEEIQDMVNHACNCIIRHRICPDGKISHTDGEEFWAKCLHHLIYWEGREAVEEYLKFMAEQTPEVGEKALLRFYVYYPSR